MSEDQVTDVDGGADAVNVTKVKRTVISSEAVKVLIEGLPQYEKAAFLVVGHKNGVRLAIPKSQNGISRIYFYGNGDYSLIPKLPGIKEFSEDQRRELRKGGIMAEVSFDQGLAEGEVALAALVDVVRRAPAPTPKPLKLKATGHPVRLENDGEPAES